MLRCALALVVLLLLVESLETLAVLLDLALIPLHELLGRLLPRHEQDAAPRFAAQHYESATSTAARKHSSTLTICKRSLRAGSGRQPLHSSAP